MVLSAIIEHRIQGLSEYRITGTAYAAWLMASIAAGITIAMALIYVCRKGIKKNAAMATPVPNEEGRKDTRGQRLSPATFVERRQKRN